jgi:hypothetical protein
VNVEPSESVGIKIFGHSLLLEPDILVIISDYIVFPLYTHSGFFNSNFIGGTVGQGEPAIPAF